MEALGLQRAKSAPELVGSISVGLRGGKVHYLVRSGEELYHFWGSSGAESGPRWVPDEGPKEMKDILSEELQRFWRGDVLRGQDGSVIRYQQFGQWSEEEMGKLVPEASEPTLVKEQDGSVTIRMASEMGRTVLSHHVRLRNDAVPVYMLSRLNAVGFDPAPRLFGMSYWTRESSVIPWLEITLLKDGTGPAFKPFLEDLSKLISEFRGADGGRTKGLLMELARRDDLVSLHLSREIGRHIGTLHGLIALERKERPTRSRAGSGPDIVDLFTPGAMDMESVGALIGRSSLYLGSLKRSLYKTLGKELDLPESAGTRKQKVLKRKPSGPSNEMPTLATFLGHLLREEKKVQGRFGSLRRFVGSPTMISGLDTGLDNIEWDGSGRFTFKRFDWSLHGREAETSSKLPLLKDLALFLNSLKKARYLSVKKEMRDISRRARKEREVLEVMFIDYNIAKPAYLQMMTDLGVYSAMGGRQVPFKHIFYLSAPTALWYERCRNSLISGYNEGLSATGREDLLTYPKGVDTLEGIRMMQVLTALSEASRTLSDPEGPRSVAGLESELLSALSP